MPKSPQALIETLRNAEAVVNDARVADDLRPIAYARSVDYLLGTPESGRPRSAVGSGDQDEGSGPIGRIANKLKLDAEAVGRVFDVDDDGVHLTVSRSALPTTKQAAMQEVARVVPAARQAAGIDEEYTPLSAIRGACDDRGVLDSSNFASAMQPLDGDGLRFRGPARSREVKVNALGYDRAAEIVQRLAG